MVVGICTSQPLYDQGKISRTTQITPPPKKYYADPILDVGGKEDIHSTHACTRLFELVVSLCLF